MLSSLSVSVPVYFSFFLSTSVVSCLLLCVCLIARLLFSYPSSFSFFFLLRPRYVRIQRQRAILLKRLKVPPAIHQFSKTLEANPGQRPLDIAWHENGERNDEMKAMTVQPVRDHVQEVRVNTQSGRGNLSPFPCLLIASTKLLRLCSSLPFSFILFHSEHDLLCRCCWLFAASRGIRVIKPVHGSWLTARAVGSLSISTDLKPLDATSVSFSSHDDIHITTS